MEGNLCLRVCVWTMNLQQRDYFMWQFIENNDDQCVDIKKATREVDLIDGTQIFFMSTMDHRWIGQKFDQIMTLGNHGEDPPELPDCIIQCLHMSKVPPEFRRIHYDCDAGDSIFLCCPEPRYVYDANGTIWWLRAPYTEIEALYPPPLPIWKGFTI